MVYGVILAAGSGSRMKSNVPKQFLTINNIFIVEYSIIKFLQIRTINKIFLVINEEYKNSSYIKKIIKKYLKYIESGKIIIITGGSERYDSVNNAIHYIDDFIGIEDNDKILIHDAARPNFDAGDVKKIINYLEYIKSITLGSKITNTIKKINLDSKLEINTLLKKSKSNDIINVVDSTIDRNSIYSIETPQGFNLKTLYSCYNKFYNLKNKIENHKKNINNIQITDDIQIIELFSKNKSYIIDSKKNNFKITTMDDLKLMKYLLKK